MPRNAHKWLTWLPLLVAFLLVLAGCSNGGY